MLAPKAIEQLDTWEIMGKPLQVGSPQFSPEIILTTKIIPLKQVPKSASRI